MKPEERTKFIRMVANLETKTDVEDMSTDTLMSEANA
jgi:hypothetical protein